MAEDILGQLLQLKASTALTGAIYEAQVLQLKMWGKLIFEGSPTIKIQVEPFPLIIYEVEKAAEQHLMEGLDRTIKDVIGEQFAVSVDVAGKFIFNSNGQEKKFKYGPDR